MSPAQQARHDARLRRAAEQPQYRWAPRDWGDYFGTPEDYTEAEYRRCQEECERRDQRAHAEFQKRRRQEEAARQRAKEEQEKKEAEAKLAKFLAGQKVRIAARRQKIAGEERIHAKSKAGKAGKPLRNGCTCHGCLTCKTREDAEKLARLEDPKAFNADMKAYQEEDARLAKEAEEQARLQKIREEEERAAQEKKEAKEAARAAARQKEEASKNLEDEQERAMNEKKAADRRAKNKANREKEKAAKKEKMSQEKSTKTTSSQPTAKPTSKVTEPLKPTPAAKPTQPTTPTSNKPNKPTLSTLVNKVPLHADAKSKRKYDSNNDVNAQQQKAAQEKADYELAAKLHAEEQARESSARSAATNKAAFQNAFASRKPLSTRLSHIQSQLESLRSLSSPQPMPNPMLLVRSVHLSWPRPSFTAKMQWKTVDVAN
jgi:hypothetical protein